LGITDGLPELEKIFKEEFQKTKARRCQVHIARNVLTKVPKKLKQTVADDVRSIFYALSKEKSLEFFSEFKKDGTRIHLCCIDLERISKLSSRKNINFANDSNIKTKG
jgi:transposase-like protein